MDRLADDRFQEECRYLMRLWWHLQMAYQEVSYSQLERNVSLEKLALLDELFRAIADADYESIDNWVQVCESSVDLLEDKGRN